MKITVYTATAVGWVFLLGGVAVWVRHRRTEARWHAQYGS